MYAFPPASAGGRNFLIIFLYLSMLRYCVMLISINWLPIAKRLKVVIAAGLTSSLSEQRS
jgi:hypothetical protein